MNEDFFWKVSTGLNLEGLSLISATSHLQNIPVRAEGHSPNEAKRTKSSANSTEEILRHQNRDRILPQASPWDPVHENKERV